MAFMSLWCVVFGFSWAVLGLSLAISGPSWAVFGASWGRLGPSWSDVWGVLGRLGREDEEKMSMVKMLVFVREWDDFCLLKVLLGVSWGVLEPSMGRLETILVVSERSWTVSVPLGTGLDTIWDCPGRAGTREEDPGTANSNFRRPWWN